MKKKVMNIIAALGLLLAGLATPVRAVEVYNNNKDASLDIGGRFQLLGELEDVTTEQIRQNMRIYLFNTEDRLTASGTFEGTQFHFEEALGGEAINSSNNQINLLEFNAEVPLIWGTSVTVGQFKVPTNLQSADYEANLLFSEKSPLQQLFFNQGYDTGIVLNAKEGIFDGLVGTISGAPDLPQRYLPEIMNFPPLMIARLGVGTIKDDPYRPKQEGYAKLDSAQWALHANGQYIDDSNAGHSTDLSLQSSYFTTFSANSYFGNSLLNTSWNPYLGKTAANFGEVDAQYYQWGLDGVYRQPVGDMNLTLQGQVNWAGYNARNFAPFIMNGKTVTEGSVNVAGAELLASLGTDDWAVSGRVDAVLPSDSFAYSYAANNYTSITGTQPIWEVTFPSVMVKVNSRVKLVGEAMYMINTPEAHGNDGMYELTEMPSQVTNATNLNPVTRDEFVAVGRMMFQLAF